MTRLEEIQRRNPKVTFLTSLSFESFPNQSGLQSIQLDCKELTIRNDSDYELIIAGSITLQPKESIVFGGSVGEYQTGSILWRWGSLVGPGTAQYFTVIRKQYAE